MGWLISQALMRDFENSRCLQAQEGESSAESSSDGEQSAPSSKTHMPQAFLSADKMKEFSGLSRSGMTFAPLTESRGEAVSMWCQEASRVRTSVHPEKKKESTVLDRDCGAKWLALSVRYDPDTCLWKTRQCSLFEDLIEFSGTLPHWGMMQGGELFRQKMSAHLMTAEDYGLWRNSKEDRPQLEQSMDGSVTGAEKMSCQNANAITANDNANSVANGSIHFVMKNGTIANSVAPEMWLTPQANEDAAGTPNGKMQKMLGNHPCIRGVEQKEWDRGTLNPNWVEWLNGWPIGWTDLGALETDKYQQWQHSHGVF